MNEIGAERWRTVRRVFFGYLRLISVHQIRAISLSSYLEVAMSAGIDGPRLLTEEGISRLTLADSEARLPAASAVGLLERSAKLAGLDSFGIRMAQRRTFASLGPLSLLLERLNSVEEVVNALSILRSNFNDVLFVSAQYRDDSVMLTFDLIPPYGGSQAADLAVGLGYLALVGASHGLWVPDAVHFTRPLPADLPAFVNFFRVPMKFDAAFNGFSFQRSALDIRLPLADPLMAAGTRHLLSMMRAPVSDHARYAISLLLPRGEATFDNVAASLGKAPKMLQRQLAAEGQTFGKILNEVRSYLAVMYLKQGNKRLTSIASALGYSSTRSFSRWFTQKFGSSPSIGRERVMSLEPQDLGVIFSLKDGDVWASWPDLRPPVNLGTHETVIAMMTDYIKQADVAVRLLSETLELL